jgi:hypothetical protein
MTRYDDAPLYRLLVAPSEANGLILPTLRQRA